MVKVCVFGSSSPSTKARYVEESQLLGKLIAERGYMCVNGAGKKGVMGGLNEGSLSAKGKVRGVIHKMFMVDSEEDSRLEDLIVADGWDLSERKAKLFEHSDCVIVMPGGVGTFDELFDGICSRSLSMKGLTNTPFCVVNVDGFYDGLIEQMRRAKEDGILYNDVEKYFHVAASAEEALDWCIAQLQECDFSTKTNATSSRVSSRLRDDRIPEKRDQDDDQCVSGGLGGCGLGLLSCPHASSLALAGSCLVLGFFLGMATKWRAK